MKQLTVPTEAWRDIHQAPNVVILSKVVRRTRDAPLQTCETKQFVPVYKQILFGGFNLWDDCLSEVLEFYLGVHKLGHVLFEVLSPKGNLCQLMVVKVGVRTRALVQATATESNIGRVGCGR